MFLFVISPLFHNRRRKSRARDEMPMEPLVDYLLFWTLLAMGSLLITAAAFALVALSLGWLHWTAGAATAAATAIAGGTFSIRRAFVYWPRIR